MFTREFTDFTPKAAKEELVLAVAMGVWAAERFLRKVDSVPVGSLGYPGVPTG